MDTQAIKSALERYFRETPLPLVCVYLYGSHARDEQRPDSDLDIAVLPARGVDSGLFGPMATVRGDLERLVGRPVDLIDLRRAPVDLVHRVLRDGLLLVEREPYERVRFEIDARNRYFDLLPHLQRYRRGHAA